MMQRAHQLDSKSGRVERPAVVEKNSYSLTTAARINVGGRSEVGGLKMNANAPRQIARIETIRCDRPLLFISPFAESAAGVLMRCYTETRLRRWPEGFERARVE